MHCSPAPIAVGGIGRLSPHCFRPAKLNDVDPLAWLTDVLERIVAGHTKHNELASLLPWNWKAAKALEAPTSA